MITIGKSEVTPVILPEASTCATTCRVCHQNPGMGSDGRGRDPWVAC